MSQEEEQVEKVQEYTDQEPQAEHVEQIEQTETQDMPIQYLQDELFDDKGPIFIQVSDPIEKGSGISKFVVYTIRGKDAQGEFETYRRFNEFFTLREVLLQHWPGQYVPPIPEKQVGGNQDTINERVRFLNIFCMKMTQIKYLYYSEEFATIFLRSGHTEINKQLQSLPKPQVQQQIEKYKKIFAIQDIQEPGSECLAKMNAVQSFMKRSQTLLIKQQEQAKAILQSRRTLKEQFINNFSQNLLEYERLVLLECLPGSQYQVLTNPAANEIIEMFRQMKENQMNPLDKIQDLIVSEQKDLDAFLQAFTSRDQVLSQKAKVESKMREEQNELASVMAGKPTIKGAFSKLTLEEQKQKLELQMMETQKEVDLYKQFYQLVTQVLTYRQIDKFKVDKHESYRTIIGELARLEAEQCQIQVEFWMKVESLVESIQQQ